MTAELAISLEGLTAGYDGVPVIEDVDLAVEERDYVGVLGPNGGGKSTLLKAILGLVTPMRGRVRIFGHGPEEGPREVGYVPQHSAFDADYPISAWDVVLMGRRPRRGWLPGWSAADRDAARDALEAVQMLDHRGAQIGELSGGQQQRVYIARALVARPRILLLDEPTASVDSAITGTIYDLLAELNREIAIVLVTHDIGVISSHVGKVACLNRQLVSHGDRHLTTEMLEQTYHCPVDLIAHGVPHRVFPDHDGHAGPAHQQGGPAHGGPAHRHGESDG